MNKISLQQFGEQYLSGLKTNIIDWFLSKKKIIFNPLIHSKVLTARDQKFSLQLTRWIDYRDIDVTDLRLLEFLLDGKLHTKSQIAISLHLWEQQIDNKLARLNDRGFVCTELIPFGDRMIRVYCLSEPGRFLMYQVNTYFLDL